MIAQPDAVYLAALAHRPRRRSFCDLPRVGPSRPLRPLRCRYLPAGTILLKPNATVLYPPEKPRHYPPPDLSAAYSTPCATAAYPPSAWWLPTASPGKTPRPGTLGHCAAIAP